MIRPGDDSIIYLYRHAGDIVPSTNISKILVALESILGILFIGLFLNSLGFHVEKS